MAKEATVRNTKGVEKRVHAREIVRLAGSGQILVKTSGETKRMHEARGGGERFAVSTADVSISGLQIHFNADLMARDTVRLVFPGGIPGRQIQVEGTLVWVRKNAVDIFGRYTAGLRFKHIDETMPKLFVAAEQGSAESR